MKHIKTIFVQLIFKTFTLENSKKKDPNILPRPGIRSLCLLFWSDHLAKTVFSVRNKLKMLLNVLSLSDYRIAGLSDYRTVRLSGCRIISLTPLILVDYYSLFDFYKCSYYLRVCTHSIQIFTLQKI
jgi:hypothetical protein